MAKLKDDAIKMKDLKEYLKSYAGFNFELSILKLLKEKGLECVHGGLYEDPITGKNREFDIRATRTINNYRVKIAAECKYIRENYPILVSCVPRLEQESFHEVAILREPEHKPDIIYEPRAIIETIKGMDSIYKPNEFVGKRITQVGREKNDGTIVASNDELFDKWSQCLSSANDLVKRIYLQDKDTKSSIFFSTVIPILVVPNERLWIVNYDFDGGIVSDPKLAERCSYFVDKGYITDAEATIMGQEVRHEIRISHIEIMTQKGLENFINTYLQTDTGIKQIFPIKEC